MLLFCDYAGGKVYFLTEHSHLFCMSANTHHHIWISGLRTGSE